MQPSAVTQARFDGMAEGVAEIENLAQTGLAFIDVHNVRLDFAAAPHGKGQRLAVARQQRVDMLFEPGEKSHVGDWPVLDHFGQAGTQLALRQRCQRVQVANDLAWLVERTHHVLAQRMVHSGLAPHR